MPGVGEKGEPGKPGPRVSAFKSPVENGLEDTGRGKGKLGRSESVLDIYTLSKVR